jgi:hypothetical protein
MTKNQYSLLSDLARLIALVAVACLLTPLQASAATVDAYGELTGKAILAPSALPLLANTLDSELPSIKEEAISFLEKEFSKSGISVVQDGPHFVRLVPSGALNAALSNAPLRGAQLTVATNQELIPAGMVNFPGTDLGQVLSIYSELKNRTVLRTRFLPSPSIRFKNQCPLTREELVYALETVLALNGILPVDDGPSFVQIVPIQLQSKVDTRAPTAEPGSKLFDPKKVPSMGPANPTRAQTKLERDLDRWRRAFFEFLRVSETRNSSAQRLLELYAGLTDTKAEPSRDYEAMPIWFHVTTPLSKTELLYAIETTFALNNLAITPAEDTKIRLGPYVGPGKSRENAAGRESHPAGTR